MNTTQAVQHGNFCISRKWITKKREGNDSILRIGGSTISEDAERRTWRRRIGGSVRHNCVQVFNIISCFISDAPKIFERRERREFGNTWSSIVHLARGCQNLLHLNAHYKFSRSVLRVSINFSRGPSNKPPPRRKFMKEKRLTIGNESDFSFLFFY